MSEGWSDTDNERGEGKRERERWKERERAKLARERVKLWKMAVEALLSEGMMETELGTGLVSRR